MVDLVGGNAQAALFGLICHGGALISAVAAPDQALARRADVHAAFILVDVSTEVLDELSRRFNLGGLCPFVGTVLPLAEAAVAHRMLDGECPHPPGKIVLLVRN